MKLQMADKNQHTAKETAQRRDEALKRALSTPPKPLKSVPRKLKPEKKKPRRGARGF
jgi:hypothetical protein